MQGMRPRLPRRMCLVRHAGALGLLMLLGSLMGWLACHGLPASLHAPVYVDGTTVALRWTRVGAWYKNVGTTAVQCWYESPFLGFTLPPGYSLPRDTAPGPLHCAVLAVPAGQVNQHRLRYPIPVQFGTPW